MPATPSRRARKQLSCNLHLVGRATREMYQPCMVHLSCHGHLRHTSSASATCAPCRYCHEDMHIATQPCPYSIHVHQLSRRLVPCHAPCHCIAPSPHTASLPCPLPWYHEVPASAIAPDSSWSVRGPPSPRQCAHLHAAGAPPPPPRSPARSSPPAPPGNARAAPVRGT